MAEINDLWNELSKNPLISGLVIFIFITVVIYIIYLNAVYEYKKYEKNIPDSIKKSSIGKIFLIILFILVVMGVIAFMFFR